MELERERLTQQIADLENALSRLSESLNEPKSDIVRDAVIQRFEFCFELSWKSLKAVNEFLGTPTQSPRDSIRVSAQNGLLLNPEKWFEYLTARNLSTHTYSEEQANDVYDTAVAFLQDAKLLLQNIKDTENTRL